MEKPKRAFELTIKIGGNTWEDVLRELSFLSVHLPEHGQDCDSVMGGCDSYHTVHVQETPGMTREKYFKELEAYRSQKPDVFQLAVQIAHDQQLAFENSVDAENIETVSSGKCKAHGLKQYFDLADRLRVLSDVNGSESNAERAIRMLLGVALHASYTLQYPLDSPISQRAAKGLKDALDRAKAHEV